MRRAWLCAVLVLAGAVGCRHVEPPPPEIVTVRVPVTVCPKVPDGIKLAEVPTPPPPPPEDATDEQVVAWYTEAAGWVRALWLVATRNTAVAGALLEALLSCDSGTAVSDPERAPTPRGGQPIGPPE